MFGSYNKFTAPVHIDAHIVSAVDFFTSIIASIVIFAALGNSAYSLGVPVELVAKGRRVGVFSLLFLYRRSRSGVCGLP